MKKVFVMRHGKSSWENPAWSDIERPLLKKGIKRTKRVAEFLKANDIRPDLILTSPAKRALRTAEILSDIWGGVPIRVEEKIYYGDSDDLDAILYGLDNNLDTVFLVGHNPDLTDWVNEYKENRIWNLPTSGVFGVAFDTDSWEDLPGAPYREIVYVEPKMLKK
ncbi:MAG: phosphohistidine phosphatase SixA [Chlorobi bacterium]|nr:phosphohistidine phosphatase SixA [Chlorobiota bacterium]